MKISNKTFLCLLLPILLAACAPAAATQPADTAVPIPPTPTSLPTETALPTAIPPTAAPTPLPVSTPWWNDAVFYEVFVRSFKDSDGDGVGDINGLIESLDYLNDGDPNTTTDLGVTGIWLMPITESPSYHGYDVVDYYAVDAEYGTKEDFLRLMDEAHQRGIRVIIDLVINHTGSDHPWFEASNAGDAQFRDWYVWEDPAPRFLGPWNQQVWYAGKDGYYYAVFWSEMPDLNLENPEVTAEIYNVTRFWLEEMGVDGFRMDAIKHLIEQDSAQENTPATHAWLQAFHQEYKSINPQAFAVGEAWTAAENAVKYVGDEMDIVFEFDLAEAFVRAANGPLASSASQQLAATLNMDAPAGQFGVFLTNHDQDRVMSVLKDVQKAKLAAVMMLTSPGVPFIYYGEEIGMTGVKPDENIRRPMQWNGENSKVGFSTFSPWRLPPSDYKEYNVADQTGDPDSLLNHYRNLIALRNAHGALRTGEAVVVEAGTQRLYALLRYNDEEAFLILVNAHPKPLTTELYSLNLPSGPFTTAVQASSALGPENPSAPQINANGGFDNYQPFSEIPAQSFAIIRLAP